MFEYFEWITAAIVVLTILYVGVRYALARFFPKETK